MAECIARSKKVCHALFEADRMDEIPVDIDPEHLMPTVVDVTLWRAGPVEGEIEVCSITGSTQVFQDGVSYDGSVHPLVSQIDMGTLGHMIGDKLRDMGGERWKLLAYMSAGSVRHEKTLSSGETVYINAVASEVVCPMDPTGDDTSDAYEYFMCNHYMEVTEDEDGYFLLRDYLDEGKSMDDLDAMDMSSKSIFSRSEAANVYPLNLAASITTRIQMAPYQNMLETAKSSVRAVMHDDLGGISFVAGYDNDTILARLGLMDQVVANMMTNEYDMAASVVTPILQKVKDEGGLEHDSVENLGSLIDQLENYIIAADMFEWSMCILSGNLQLVKEEDWGMIKKVMELVGGTGV